MRIKHYTRRYFENIIYPIVVYLWIFIVISLIIELNPYQGTTANPLYCRDEINLLRNIASSLFWLMLIVVLLPFLYKVYKGKWKDAVFLLLVSIFGPIVIFITYSGNTFYYVTIW